MASSSRSSSGSPPDPRAQTAKPSDYLFQRPINTSSHRQQLPFIPLPRSNAPATVRLPSAPSATAAQNPSLPRPPQPPSQSLTANTKRVAIPSRPSAYPQNPPISTASMPVPAHAPTPKPTTHGSMSALRPLVASNASSPQFKGHPGAAAASSNTATPTTQTSKPPTSAPHRPPVPVSAGVAGGPIDSAGFVAFKAQAFPGPPRPPARQSTTAPLSAPIPQPQGAVTSLQTRPIQATSGRQPASTAPARPVELRPRPELQRLIDSLKATHVPNTGIWSSLDEIMSRLPPHSAGPQACYISRLDFVGREVDGGQNYGKGTKNGTAVISFSFTTTDGQVLHHICAIDTTPWSTYEGVDGINAYWQAVKVSYERRLAKEHRQQNQPIANILRVVLWRDKDEKPRIGLKCTYRGRRPQTGGAQVSSSKAT